MSASNVYCSTDDINLGDLNICPCINSRYFSLAVAQYFPNILVTPHVINVSSHREQNSYIPESLGVLDAGM